MTGPSKRRLKVYRTTIGFYDSVVAAANQRGALDAWGVRQNLFAEGAAKLEDDPGAVKAALAAPGQPLRRPLGSKGAYSIKPDAPEDLRPAKGAARTPKARKPDRRKLDAAEAALNAVDERQAAEAEVLQARRSELEADEASAKRRWKTERETAAAKVDAARAAYRQASER